MVLVIFLLLTVAQQESKERIFEYNGSKVLTTYDVGEKFIGTYKGAKSGYLVLNQDGTGSYQYDVFAFALEGCRNELIRLEWGFMIDDQKEVVRFEREYGFSYPILMRALSPEASFQGCRKQIMLDFIIESEGKLNVSSSDDWAKD